MRRWYLLLALPFLGLARRPRPVGHHAQVAYATLALGSAMALFHYPHAPTAVLSSRSQDVVRRNMSLLPAWTFLLGLMALLGYMAIAQRTCSRATCGPWAWCSAPGSRPRRTSRLSGSCRS
jgi:hypothetical protein